MRNLPVYLLLLSLSQLIFTQACIGESGRNVDWWVVLKTTKNVAYGYFDSEMESRATAFIVKDLPFSNPSGAVSRTLVQINTLNNMETMAWSDQPPGDTASSSYAHAKGLITFSRANGKGYAIQHSLPQYPEFSAGNKINPVNKNNSNVYGQTIFCQSLNVSALNSIAQKFKIVKPFVYFSSIKITGSKTTADLESLSQRGIKIPKSSVAIDTIDYRVGSTQIKGVFKAAGHKYSIFGDHALNVLGLPRLLNSSIYVETWRGDDGNFCNPSSRQSDDVMYINQIRLGKYSWRRTADHSKWVVSVNGEWSCIGGMNRQQSQWSRGGQFFCIQSRNLNRAFMGIIADKSSCGASAAAVPTSSRAAAPKLKRRNTWGHYEAQ